MFICHENEGQLCTTFQFTGEMTVGAPCTMAYSNIIKASDADEAFVGIIASVRGNIASVIMRGLVTVGYSGNMPSIGFTALVADGTGKVKMGESGNTYAIVAVDTNAKTVTFLI